MARFLPQPQQKLQQNYKTTITQNHQKNQAVWKSDNKEFKEVTFIQMGSRGRDVEQEVPHPHVVDNNQEGYSASKRSQPHTRQPSPGFQCQIGKSP